MSATTIIEPCLSVVIPAYNEAATLEEVVLQVLAVPYLLEVIVVDNGSTDGTAEVTERLASAYPQVRVVRLEHNTGKTGALKAGFALSKGEIVVVQDADLEYDPVEISDLILPILEGHADVVYGSRFMVRRAARVLYYYHLIANKLLTNFSNMLTNLNMTDVMTGYKAFRGEIIRDMKIVAHGFGFEIEVTAKIAKLKCAIYEVPISYYGRTYEEGKKVTSLDGLVAFWYVVRFNLFWNRRTSFRNQPVVKPIAASRTSSVIQADKRSTRFLDSTPEKNG